MDTKSLQLACEPLIYIAGNPNLEALMKISSAQ